MALVAVAADKGAPGVTTASLALAAVWPRPVLLAECDAAGGDLFYRLPAADGGRLDPQRGLLSLAVAARRGIQPHQVWRHTQKLHGGLDILTGLVNAEQAGGLVSLWGAVGKLLADVPEVDVIADCGRLGADGPFYDLLAHSSAVVLVARITLEDVVRLRDRVIALSQGLANRRMSSVPLGVVIVANRKNFKRHISEAGQALALNGAPARIIGGLADEPKTAQMLSGRWSTKLDRSLLIRTARELAGHIARDLPAPAGVTAAQGQHAPGWWPAERRAAQSPGAPPQPGQVPPEQASAEQMAAGQEGAGQVTAGLAVAAPGVTGNATTEQITAGAQPTAAPNGWAPNGWAPNGWAPNGWAPAGQAAADLVASGEAAGNPPAAAQMPAGGRYAAPPGAPPAAVAQAVGTHPAPMHLASMPTGLGHAPGPGAPPPVAAVPDVRVRAEPEPAAMPVLGVPVVTGLPMDMPLAFAPVPVDAVPLGVPVLGVEAATGPMPVVTGPMAAMPFAAAPVPADAVPEHTPAGQMRAGQVPAGQVPAGQRPAGQVPAGQRPAGQKPAGQISAGQVLAGPGPEGQVPVGHGLAGQPPSGEVAPGQARSDQAKSGQTRTRLEPLVPLPAPTVPHHAEHVVPLRLARGPELASTGPVPATRMPADLEPRAGAQHASANHATANNAGANHAGASNAGVNHAGASNAGASNAGASHAGASHDGASNAGASHAGASNAGASNAGASNTGAGHVPGQGAGHVPGYNADGGVGQDADQSGGGQHANIRAGG